jgi:FtsP/CotA-like multicopper oxidase with cupredoxin domain
LTQGGTARERGRNELEVALQAPVFEGHQPDRRRAVCCHAQCTIAEAGMATAGVMKDAVMLGGYQERKYDFVADDPGLTLFHCHQQLHMDFGFVTLFDYV